jgi:Tol biopolymer transport system component
LLRKAPILADGTLGPATPVFRDNPEPIVRDFDLSPDGRLLAYATPQADGSAAVFLTDVPATANRWLVAAGGRHPHFSRDGREIVVTVGHVDEQGRPIGELRSTGISYGPPVRLGPSERLFDDASDTAPFLDKLSVSPDGRHFLMAVPAQGNGPRVVILQNWPALLGR